MEDLGSVVVRPVVGALICVGALDRLGLPLRVVRREPFAALPWLLSGGFQPSGLLPEPLLPAAERVDRLLSAAPRLTAMRCLLVIERTR